MVSFLLWWPVEARFMKQKSCHSWIMYPTLDISVVVNSINCSIQVKVRPKNSKLTKMPSNVICYEKKTYTYPIDLHFVTLLHQVQTTLSYKNKGINYYIMTCAWTLWVRMKTRGWIVSRQWVVVGVTRGT